MGEKGEGTGVKGGGNWEWGTPLSTPSVMVERLFLAVPRGCLQFVVVVFPDHTHLLFTIREFRCSNT